MHRASHPLTTWFTFSEDFAGHKTVALGKRFGQALMTTSAIYKLVNFPPDKGREKGFASHQADQCHVLQIAFRTARVSARLGLLGNR